MTIMTKTKYIKIFTPTKKFCRTSLKILNNFIKFVNSIYKIKQSMKIGKINGLFKF